MPVDVECGLEIRVPEKCLGGLDGLADFTEQGSVGVTEGVPADGRESESAACWSKVPMRQVRRVQGGSFSSTEDEIVESSVPGMPRQESGSMAATHFCGSEQETPAPWSGPERMVREKE